MLLHIPDRFWVDNVQEMVRDPKPLSLRDLGSSNIGTPIYLDRIDVHYLAV
jgi:hypothetical protein